LEKVIHFRRPWGKRPGRTRRVALPLRAGLAGGLAAALLFAAADTAQAQLFDSIFGSPYRGSGYYYVDRPRPVAPATPYYQKPKRKQAEGPKKDATVKPPTGPLLIAISLNKQRLTLYSSGKPIAHAPVSTGTASHPTPTGIFSVIGKEKFHRSNLYSNAPMPWMQRITWSGVALHQGVLPGYPASHGCIRLPGAFAQSLFGTTRMGARVIITRDETAPFEIAHATLFAPRQKTDEEPEPGRPADQVQAQGVQVAQNEPATATDALKPAQAAAAAAPETPKLKGSLDAPRSGTAPAAGGAGRTTKGQAVAAEMRDVVDTQPPSATAVDATATGAPAESKNKPGRAAVTTLKEKPKMSEPVSVFISRKTGRLYVRQGFEPLFDVPVTIRDPELALGTHIYTATDFTEDKTAMRWVAVTLPVHQASAPSEAARVRPQKKSGRQETEQPVHVPASARVAAAAALDRITMPPDAVERISGLLSPGSSLIVSDYPISNETGKYTDFIILTR
jgi:lipoprotein-anchoring transpeptidase ErfK/SrfK